MFQTVWIKNLMGRHMINFEEDKANVLQKTENIRSLADQVERLESLQTRLELQEDNIKNTKKELEHVSGEIIPTMMSEICLLYTSPSPRD